MTALAGSADIGSENMDSTEEIAQAFSEFWNVGVAGLTVSKLAHALLTLAVCLIVVKLLLRTFDRIITRTSIEPTLHTFLRTAIKVVLLFLVVLIVADSLNFPVTSLIAVLSVFGLAVSLAVQNSLSNIAGGIQLLTSKPFKVGDYVQAGGMEGHVREIGIIYTRIATWDNKLIQIPNSQISGEKIVNYTAEPERRVDLTFSVSYDAPADTVRGTIMQVIAAHPLTLTKPEPSVRVAKYGESSIDYAMRAWCATDDYWTVYYDMLEQVKTALDQAGVEMTYPHLNVHVVEPKQ